MTIGAYAPKRRGPDRQEDECVCEVRAEIVSLGGGIVLFLAIILTSAAVAVRVFPEVTMFQRIILGVLAIGAWLYLFDSASERLRLVDHSVEYTSLLGRGRSASLRELEAMLLVHQGFNLERGMETIEFRRRGAAPERFALGPCWQRNKLEAFLHSVEEALRDPHLLEEVR